MISKRLKLLLALGMLFFGVCQSAYSQVQIPTLQVCNGNRAFGGGLVHIDSRIPPGFAGNFGIKLELKCDPKGSGFPGGTLRIDGINMNDSAILGDVEVTLFEQVTTTGRTTPTLYLNGQCKYYSSTAPTSQYNTCRIWVMIADNRSANGTWGTEDIVSFLVFDAQGNRIAYGTGPLVQGDISVSSNGE